MKLKHITFTGLDARTNVEDLVAIQKKCPLVEFGVLMSKNWEQNGNRYPNPELIQRFLDHGLNLSAHLCGSLAREAFKGCLEPVMSIYQAFEHPDFKRVQLNVSPYESIYLQADTLKLKVDKEFIIQQHSPTLLHSQGFNRFEEKNPDTKVTMLIDPSGGSLPQTTRLVMPEVSMRTMWRTNSTPLCPWILSMTSGLIWSQVSGLMTGLTSTRW